MALFDRPDVDPFGGRSAPPRAPALSGTAGGVFGAVQTEPQKSVFNPSSNPDGRDEPPGPGVTNPSRFTFKNDVLARVGDPSRQRLLETILNNLGGDKLRPFVQGPSVDDRLVGFNDIRRILGSNLLSGQQRGFFQDIFGNLNGARFAPDVIQGTNVTQLDKINTALASIDPNILGGLLGGGAAIGIPDLQRVHEAQAIQDQKARNFLQHVFGFDPVQQQQQGGGGGGGGYGGSSGGGGNQSSNTTTPPPDTDPDQAAPIESGPFILRDGRDYGLFGSSQDSLQDLVDRILASLGQ